MRRVRPINGHPRIRIVLRPRGEWGSVSPTLTRGSNHLRYVLPVTTLRVNTSAPPTYVAEGTWFSLHSPVSLLIGPDETLSGGIEETARDFEEQTSLYWRHWTRRLALPLEWQEAVIRAAITLKLCQFEETGAIVAAMTTSIPEAPDSGRNWDYRYCWIRDAFFVVRALNALSEVGTMEDYLRWLHDVVRGTDGHIQPLYGIGLERELTEQHRHLVAGLSPAWARCAWATRRSSTSSTTCTATSCSARRRLFTTTGCSAAPTATTSSCSSAWASRRGSCTTSPMPACGSCARKARVHTSSSLMCWAACDRLSKAALVLAIPERAAHWRERADHIRQRILDSAWNEERKAFAAAFGARDLDASVLLMAEVGFLPASDPRFISTVDVLERTLCDGPFMRRYEAPDDFGLPQTAFNVCAFWRVDALARIGRLEQARESFEALLAHRNPMGLLSEDLDPKNGRLWGNFPQTYSMVGIINGAMLLSKPWSVAV